ncbi:hypothetical protein RJ55_08663 [Drechmeria coniospora]|nr:hypothetical protein RJ55_08663 [Drechmeria coniospora]
MLVFLASAGQVPTTLACQPRSGTDGPSTAKKKFHGRPCILAIGAVHVLPVHAGARAAAPMHGILVLRTPCAGRASRCISVPAAGLIRCRLSAAGNATGGWAAALVPHPPRDRCLRVRAEEDDDAHALRASPRDGHELRLGGPRLMLICRAVRRRRALAGVSFGSDSRSSSSLPPVRATPCIHDQTPRAPRSSRRPRSRHSVAGLRGTNETATGSRGASRQFDASTEGDGAKATTDARVPWPMASGQHRATSKLVAGAVSMFGRRHRRRPRRQKQPSRRRRRRDGLGLEPTARRTVLVDA